MRRRFAMYVLVVVGAVAQCWAADPRASDHRAPDDVSTIVAWLTASEKSEVFGEPFGDSGYLRKAKDAIVYSDVDGATLPPNLRRVPYDVIKSRLEAVRNGHDVDPAVLITRSVAGNAEQVAAGREEQPAREAVPGERYYYVEVAIGNLAWHWIKLRLNEIDGKLKAEVVESAVS